MYLTSIISLFRYTSELSILVFMSVLMYWVLSVWLECQRCNEEIILIKPLVEWAIWHNTSLKTILCQNAYQNGELSYISSFVRISFSITARHWTLQSLIYTAFIAPFQGVVSKHSSIIAIRDFNDRHIIIFYDYEWRIMTPCCKINWAHF